MELRLFINNVKLLSVDGELSSSFSVKLGSTSSPLLFIMAIDVVPEDVRDGSLM